MHFNKITYFFPFTMHPLAFLHKGYTSICLKATKKKKKKLCFTAGRTFQVGSVCQDIFLQIFFFFLVAKMTPLKTQKFPKKSDVLLRKKFGKVFSVIFNKFQPNCLQLWLKMADLHDFCKPKKKKKILPKWKIWVGRALRISFLFFLWP